MTLNNLDFYLFRILNNLIILIISYFCLNRTLNNLGFLFIDFYLNKTLNNIDL